MQIASQDRAQEAILAEQGDEALVEALRGNNEAQALLSIRIGSPHQLCSSILSCHCLQTSLRRLLKFLMQALFEEAIEKSKGKGLGNGYCWYPYSYLVGYLLRRAQFLLDGKFSSHSEALENT